MNNLLRLIILGVLLAFAILIVGLGMARNTSDLLAPVHLLLFAIGVAVYFLPTMLAFYRDCKATVWIGVVDVFLGWTIVGWFVAMGWAASGKVQSLPPTITPPSGQALHGH
jgi:Superinfection immunity protein